MPFSIKSESEERQQDKKHIVLSYPIIFNNNYSRNFVLYFKMYVGYYETMLLKNIDKKMNPFLAFFLHS